jgi:hypothetical protein
MTYLVSILTLYFLNVYSVLLIPLVIQATKTIVKRCYDCNEVLERHDLFSIPSFNDKVRMNLWIFLSKEIETVSIFKKIIKKVLNFRFGNCAIILSRKYAYIIIILFITVYAFVQSQRPPQLPDPADVCKILLWINFFYSITLIKPHF